MATLLALALLATVAHSDSVDALAAEHGLDPVALQGALNTTGAAPDDYLRHEGLLPPMDPRAYLYWRYGDTAITRRIDCVVWHESRWTPRAKNPRSTAAGLAQFIDSTWARTPQGRAGLSVYDPYANLDATYWMVTGGGSWREWAVVTAGLC